VCDIEKNAGNENGVGQKGTLEKKGRRTLSGTEKMLAPERGGKVQCWVGKVINRKKKNEKGKRS